MSSTLDYLDQSYSGPTIPEDLAIPTLLPDPLNFTRLLPPCINCTDSQTPNNFTLSFESPISVFYNEESTSSENCSVSYNVSPTADAVISYIRTTELVLALILNILLFVSILTNRKLRRKHSVKFFANLQLVHVLLTALLLLRTFHYDNNDVKLHVINGFLMEMFLSMVICTLDRLLAIKYPYLYERVTTAQVILIIASLWLPMPLFAVFTVLFHAPMASMRLFSSVLIAIATIILVTSNCVIYVIARRHCKSIQKSSCYGNQNSREQGKLLKSSLVCLCIVLSFVVSWCPFLVVNLIHLGVGCDGVGVDVAGGVEVVAILNSVLDPVLFVVFRKDVKKELRITVRKVRGKEAPLPTVTFSSSTSYI